MSDAHDTAIEADVVEIDAYGQSEAAIPARLVEMALARDSSPETLHRLLDLQERTEAMVARRRYDAAMARVQAELPAALARDQRVSYGGGRGTTSYTHTSLAAAVAVIRPVLARHGVTLSWDPSTPDARTVTVTCRLSHGGHTEAVAISAPPDDRGSKSASQAVASTITLLERYTLLAMLGLATEDQREPTGQAAADPATVDTAATTRALTALRRRGVALAAAESELGLPAAEWTRADLRRLRDWLDGQESADE